MKSKAEPTKGTVSKGLTIKGIRFLPGEVDWEDAYGHSRTRRALPDFEAMRKGEAFIGSKITSAGLVGKIGKYLLVITEKDEMLEEFDFTVIPLHPRTQVRYH